MRYQHQARRKAGPDEAAALPRTLKARSRPADTTLQRHVSFFDDNGNRGVNVAECARGLKALGLPIGVAEVAAFAIVAALSRQTRGSLLTMNVDIENAQQGKHDSDTGILDKRGRFNARRFDKVFGAHSNKVVLRRHALLQAGERTRLERIPRRAFSHGTFENQSLAIMSVRYRTDSVRSCV